MSRNKSGFGKFLAGALIGVGLGVLFAPQEGSKTRAQLKAKLDELWEKVKNIDVKEVKENLEAKIKEIKEGLKDLDGEKALAIAKEKGRALLKKCDELVKLAVEKGTPVVEKVANDVRLKTIDVLEETVKKLEAAPSKAAAKKTATKKTVAKKAVAKKA